MSTSVASPQKVGGVERFTSPGEESYYLQKAGVYVGNCMQWWKKRGGYTCNLLDAQKFQAHEAANLAKNGDFFVWPVSHAEALVQWHVVGGGGE
jgi:hypothetical protein